MINSDRLSQNFTRFVKIDSVSREEAEMAAVLKTMLEDRGATVVMDNAGEVIGGNCGNLVAKFKGTVDAQPLLLSGHMDTVEPGRGIKPVLENGVFKSDGATILGSDDKSALAIIFEVLDVIQENNLPHPPIEVVFTVAEEVGLMGAKAFDLSMIDAKIGYILDSTDRDGIVTRAPAANRFTIKIHGKDAHAGAFPENGINAISVASKAISGLHLGRIDNETTCNIGLIKGGKATNIVPDLVTVHGEVRSHDEAKLKTVTETILNAFHVTADEFKKNHGDLPRVEIDLEQDFPATHVPDDHIVVKLACKAAENVGQEMAIKTIGGGADANIFFGKGVVTGVLYTGMTDVHTVRESIKLDDMVGAADLLLEIIRIHSTGEVE
ncbi:tripeptide aminopeptidase [Desulfocicer vacuolatum DSM 3385]|uniref:Tripeptide aminopeptidase n=1 Tax=Desulfocicer vacuolatum DSM 3385 TaxID=1121400 RepID=A0A1W2D3M5_9BACT|nr:M20/M25/M40 family metallo-hydrolase [Desulfocicer vacuolatum]SMC91672.1 tripeptide aminopeptidase [Desulfocicer vacuolatum DSM 3385]